MKHFRRIRKGESQRHADCNDCRNLQQRRATAYRRERTASQFASQIKKLGPDPHKLIGIANAMWLRFKGPHGVAQAFHEAMQNATNAGRHGTTGRLMMAIVNLCATGQEVESNEVESLSDEELARRSQQSLESLVEADPRLAIDALRAAGYQVIPPGESG